MNEDHIIEDFIGESKVNIIDLLNLIGSNDEYEGFFHIMNKGESCGQINLKINFSYGLRSLLSGNSFKHFKNTNQNNMLINEKTNIIIPNKSIVIPNKSYQFIPKQENNYESNMSSEQLWNLFNNNLVIINCLNF